MSRGDKWWKLYLMDGRVLYYLYFMSTFQSCYFTLRILELSILHNPTSRTINHFCNVGWRILYLPNWVENPVKIDVRKRSIPLFVGSWQPGKPWSIGRYRHGLRWWRPSFKQAPSPRLNHPTSQICIFGLLLLGLPKGKKLSTSFADVQRIEDCY